jgi:hypothetical protein
MLMRKKAQLEAEQNGNGKPLIDEPTNNISSLGNHCS